MQTAELWSTRSKCKRAQVGAIIAKDGRIISNGYNGTVAGSPSNCCEEDVLRCPECSRKYYDDEEICLDCSKPLIKSTQTKNNVVHAEANSILFAARNGIKTEGCTMYVTLAPCIECAKMIKQAGISRVVYGNDYRKSECLEFLERNNVRITQKQI